MLSARFPRTILVVGTILALATPLRAEDEDLANEVRNLEEMVEYLRNELEGESSSSASGPSIQLKGFGHVMSTYESLDMAGPGEIESGSHFALGGMDLFLTSRLSDRVSFLNETVFEPTEEGEYVLDVERVIVKYFVSDRLNVQAGRFHSTIGYWNETYHHGEWLQTSIGRPSLLSFEDEDGLLPVHVIGLVLGGRTGGDAIDVKYTAEIGNGRGATPDPPQIVVDSNDSKSANLSITLLPSSVPGLGFGGGLFIDRIPENLDAEAGPTHGKIDERILAAHLYYVTGPWELLAEWMGIRHDAVVVSESSGYYIQFAHRFDKFVPYAGWDEVLLDDTHTFFTSTDDVATASAGVRWDIMPWNALKLEVSRISTKAAPGGMDSDATSVEFQTAFAF